MLSYNKVPNGYQINVFMSETSNELESVIIVPYVMTYNINAFLNCLERANKVTIKLSNVFGVTITITFNNQETQDKAVRIIENQLNSRAMCHTAIEQIANEL